jgi:L-seryl-tRNA(Ser) seleniumtransferase
VEAAFITSGASAGLFLSTAALLAGTDPKKMMQLPDTTGMRNEVIVCRAHRHGFDHILEVVGAKLVEIGLTAHGTFPQDMELAINENTAFCFYTPSFLVGWDLEFEAFRDIAQAHNLPILVDFAGAIPPASNLHKYTDLGADLVVFSGGKGLRGPQGTGLILGRADLIEACAANSSPNTRSIGRMCKVSKEDIVGMVAALEIYLDEISKVEGEIWEGMVKYIVDGLGDIPYVTAGRYFPQRPEREIPVVSVRIEDESPVSCGQVVEELLAHEPSIRIYGGPGTRYRGLTSGFGFEHGKGFLILPSAMQEGEEVIVLDALRSILMVKG